MPTKGGGSQNQQTSPWTGAQPFITDSLGAAQRAYQTPPQFYQGNTYVGATGPELSAWGGRVNYSQNAIGNAPTPQFGDVVNTNQAILRGETGAGNLSGSLQPIASQSVQQSFQGPTDLQQRSFDAQLNPNAFTPQLGGPDQLQQRSFDAQLNPNAFAPNVNGPYQLQARSFDPRLDMSSFTPGFGQAGGLDARGAYQNMLSGQPDYEGVQGAIRAANDPLMRDFEQNLLPQIAGRSGISGHDTGSIKLLNRTLPELGERMSSNALAITEGERQRALSAQERAAGAVTQGGYQGYGLGLQGAGQDLQSRQALAQFGLTQDLAKSDISRGYNADALSAYGMGLQGASQQAGMNQALAQYGTNQDLARANLNAAYRGDMLNAQQLGLQGAQAQAGLNQAGAQFGYQQDMARAGLQGDYRNSALNLAGLSGNLGNQQTAQQLAAAEMWPSIYSTGMDPYNQIGNYAAFDRGIREQELDDSIRRWDFEQNQPMNMAQWYANLAQGFGRLGSQSTGSGNSNSMNIGNILGGIGGLVGAFAK